MSSSSNPESQGADASGEQAALFLADLVAGLLPDPLSRGVRELHPVDDRVRDRVFADVTRRIKRIREKSLAEEALLMLNEVERNRVDPNLLNPTSLSLLVGALQEELSQTVLAG